MASDIYLNWVALQVRSHPTQPDELSGGLPSNGQIVTGMGVATKEAWRIHKVEVYPGNGYGNALDDHVMEIVLSTRSASTTLPGLDQKGTIVAYRERMNQHLAGTGTGIRISPFVYDYMPPMIIASPRLNLYTITNQAVAGFADKVHFIRIGMTAEKLTDAGYREVWETWNFAN